MADQDSTDSKKKHGWIVTTTLAIVLLFLLGAVVKILSAPRQIAFCQISQDRQRVVLTGVRPWTGDVTLAESHAQDFDRLLGLAHSLGCPNASSFGLPAAPAAPSHPQAPACVCSCVLPAPSE